MPGPGGVCSRGAPGPRGVPDPGGAWSWGDCLVLGGCLVPGLYLVPGGARSWGDGIPACAEADPPGRDGYCCGRYASYWNAFLLLATFHLDV